MTAPFERRRPTEHLETIDDFVSAAECAELLAELRHALWKPSRTYERQSDNTYRNVAAYDRVSESAQQDFFGDGLVDRLACVEARLVDCFGVDPDRLEWWQATRYPIGGMLGYHLDAGYWDGHYAGDRARTFLLYLTTPTEGGGTHFRALDLLVEARARRLVVWDDLFADGSPNHSMIHAAAPVRAGEKVTLVTWERQRSFRSPPEAGAGETPRAAKLGGRVRA
jgi:prolyl 4-hydroxylase